MKKLLLSLIILPSLLLIFTTPLSAQWVQIGQDIEGESASVESGHYTCISGDGKRVAVGSRKTTLASDSGYVRIFEYNASNWIAVGSPIKGDQAGEFFGSSVSINYDGSVIVAGAIYDDNAGSDNGSASVYEYVSNNWVQKGNCIYGVAPSDEFGRQVSINDSGNVVAISSHNHDNSRGHVRIFEYTAGSWIQLGSDIDGDAINDFSGYSISLSADGNRIAISAIFNDGTSMSEGQVRVFEYNGTSWLQVGSDIYGENSFDSSGDAVSLNADGSVLAIGAIYYSGVVAGAGHVRVFSDSSGTWVQKGVDINGQSYDDNCGQAVCLDASGNNIIVSSIGNGAAGTFSGHVRIFEYVGTSWVQKGTNINGQAAGDFFGISASISSDATRVAIGAPYNSNAGYNAGHLRMYQYGITNIANLTNNEVLVYPNPTSSILYVNNAEYYEKIYIYSIAGSLIYKQEINSNKLQLNLNSLPKGVYLIELSNTNGKLIKKIMVR